MAVAVEKIPDPDLPNRTLYTIKCPNCNKVLSGSSEKAAQHQFVNHRQVHNGERKE